MSAVRQGVSLCILSTNIGPVVEASPEQVLGRILVTSGDVYNLRETLATGEHFG